MNTNTLCKKFGELELGEREEELKKGIQGKVRSEINDSWWLTEAEGKGESSGLQDQASSGWYQLSYKLKQLSSKSKQKQEHVQGWGGGTGSRGLQKSPGNSQVPVPQLPLRLMVLEPLGALHPWPSRTPGPLVSFSCTDSPTSGPPNRHLYLFLY